ncbi:MAG: SDR family oxidoreductase [Hyphomicrobiales bacterium]|nr:SDR family oxidoreductase [Hyphomicrobiales bacterium]
MAKTVLITGAARGIGAATARLAAARGYDVCFTYRGRDGAAAALAADIEARGRRALPLVSDAGSEDDIRALFARVDAEFGRLDAFVGNAGITGAFTRLDEIDPAMLRRVVDINVVGLILACKEAVRRMSSRHGGPGGAIVLVSSVAARLGSPGEYVHYAATKGAVDSLTVGLAREVAREGVRVNAVAPGLVNTDIHGDAGRPDRAADNAPNIPLGRPGEAEEIAESILWLLSDAAAYCTGSVLTVSGGR